MRDRERLKDDSSESSSASTIGYPYSESCYAFLDRAKPAKKAKQNYYTAEIIVEILDRNGNLVPIQGLLDTGTSSTICLRQFVKRGRAKTYKGKKTVWNTMGGNFQTSQKALLDFKFP